MSECAEQHQDGEAIRRPLVTQFYTERAAALTRRAALQSGLTTFRDQFVPPRGELDETPEELSRTRAEPTPRWDP